MQFITLNPFEVHTAAALKPNFVLLTLTYIFKRKKKKTATKTDFLQQITA